MAERKMKMTTKEQELKALAQIKKIVAGLGEDSYIAAAFDGCFEIAETNIQNDWACSMKQRAASAEQRAEAEQIAKRDAVDAMKRWQKIADDATTRANDAKHEIDNLHEDIAKTREALQQLQISASTIRNHARETYESRIRQLEKAMLSAADMMEAYADHPQDIAYKNALDNYRKAKAERDEMKRGLVLVQDLENCIDFEI